jgi:hypothetical protein
MNFERTLFDQSTYPVIFYGINKSCTLFKSVIMMLTSNNEKSNFAECKDIIKQT